jgi:hypothetical protein
VVNELLYLCIFVVAVAAVVAVVAVVAVALASVAYATIKQKIPILKCVSFI